MNRRSFLATTVAALLAPKLKLPAAPLRSVVLKTRNVGATTVTASRWYGRQWYDSFPPVL